MCMAKPCYLEFHSIAILTSANSRAQLTTHNSQLLKSQLAYRLECKHAKI